MRDLGEVINQMLDEIPETEGEFIDALKDNLSSVSAAPPEMMRTWWNEVYSTLSSHIGNELEEDWQFTVASIFSTKSVEQLKREFGKE